MTFTYNSTSITTDLAKVRLTIGDTNSADALLTDEEINALIALEGSGAGVLRWAARCCEQIANQYARDFNWKGDGTEVNKGDRAKHYAALAVSLRKRADTGLTVVQTRHDDGWQANRGVDHKDVSTTGDPVGEPYF